MIACLTTQRMVTVYCKDCGEGMEGDGFSVVIHCPNADFLFWYDKEPDAAPVHCENMNECSYCSGTGEVEGIPIDGGPHYRWMKPKKHKCYKCNGTGHT